jgi:hypothetical protein
MDEVKSEMFRLTWNQVRAWRSDNVMNVPAARRLVEAGASPDDLAVAMNAAAYEVAFAMMFMLDERGGPNGEPGRDSWALVDAATGSPIDGLHEEFLMADPTGNEGTDLFA